MPGGCRVISPRALLMAIAACASVGCLGGEVRGIGCDDDGACPSDYFCDIPRGECRAQTDAFGAPALVVRALRDPGGDEVRTPYLPPGATSTIALLTENAGLGTAEQVEVDFAYLSCFAFDVDEASEPERLDPGVRVAIEVAVTPAPDCEGLSIIDWFMSYSGRETRGAFDVNVRDPG